MSHTPTPWFIDRRAGQSAFEIAIMGDRGRHKVAVVPISTDDAGRSSADAELICSGYSVERCRVFESLVKLFVHAYSTTDPECMRAVIDEATAQLAGMGIRVFE